MMREYNIYCEECDVTMTLEVDGAEEEPKFCPFCAGDLDILDDDDD